MHALTACQGQGPGGLAWTGHWTGELTDPPGVELQKTKKSFVGQGLVG